MVRIGNNPLPQCVKIGFDMEFYSRSNLPPRRGFSNDLPTMTEQSHLHDVNINDIISRYNRTGVLGDPFKEYSEGVFADVSDIKDFHVANTQLAQAKQDFDALPSVLRKRFNNSALELLDFLADENNDDEAIKLGLKVKRFASLDHVYEGVGTVTQLDVTVPTDTKADAEVSK